MAINDGGPAFPATTVHVLADGQVMRFEGPGMSLRDWFAGMALQGMIASHGTAHSAWDTVAPDANASLAYTIANAMLREREQ